jgi:hypothetical protein
MKKDFLIYKSARISAFAAIYFNAFIKAAASIPRKLFIFINHSNLEFNKINYQYIDINPKRTHYQKTISEKYYE